MKGSMRQVVAPFPVPSNWQLFIASGGRPNTTGFMQITSWQNNQFQGTLNVRGTPVPVIGNWNPSTLTVSFESPYVSFQGRLNSFTDATATYWKIEGHYLSKISSDYPGAHGAFVAATTTL